MNKFFRKKAYETLADYEIPYGVYNEEDDELKNTTDTDNNKNIPNAVKSKPAAPVKETTSDTESSQKNEPKGTPEKPGFTFPDSISKHLNVESLKNFWNDYKSPISWAGIPALTALLASKKKNKLRNMLLFGVGGLGLKAGIDYLSENNESFNNMKNQAVNWATTKFNNFKDMFNK